MEKGDAHSLSAGNVVDGSLIRLSALQLFLLPLLKNEWADCNSESAVYWFLIFFPIWFKGGKKKKTVEESEMVVPTPSAILGYGNISAALYVKGQLNHPGLKLPGHRTGGCFRGMLFNDTCRRRPLQCLFFLVMHCMFPEKCCHLLEWFF